MKSKRKVMNNGSGFLTCLILVCILFVAGVTVAGYDYFRTLQDRQKMVEDKVNHTLEKNLSEGMEKIEKKIIYQQLPLEEEETDTALQEEIERVREENRIANQKTACEVLNRLNLQDGLAQDTLTAMQLQLDAIKNDTANTDHISQLEEYLNSLKEGIQGLEETDRNNKNSLLDKIKTLEQLLTEYHSWLENVEKSIREINSNQDTANINYHKELEVLENHIQEMKMQIEVNISELQNLTEEYRTQTVQYFEQTDGRIHEVEQQLQNQYTAIEKQYTAIEKELQNQYAILENKLSDLEQRLLAQTDEMEKMLLVRIKDLETALKQFYTKDEIDLLLKNLSLDALNKKVVEIEKQVNDCFHSVSDGKRRIASAITDKGINTAADATFQQMAENINGLVTMSTNPSVIFDTSSWTAPYDCIAVMSFSVSFTGNDDYEQKATVHLSGVKSWEASWGKTHDSSWHDWGLSGNVAWEAKAGQTYNLSFNTTNDGHILTWGWNSRTWIVPQSAARSKTVSNSLSFYEKKDKLNKNGKLSEGVPWKEEKGTKPENDKREEDNRSEETIQGEEIPSRSEEHGNEDKMEKEENKAGEDDSREITEAEKSEKQTGKYEQENENKDGNEEEEAKKKDNDEMNTEETSSEEANSEALEDLNN